MATSSRLAKIDRPTDSLWRISVDRYHDMIAGGILTDDDRVELLDGMLVEKMTKNPPHTVATQLMRSLLEGIVAEGWFVRSQEPITLDESEPEPDLSIVRGLVRAYVSRHPFKHEVGLVVEIADASLLRDRGIKLQLYAQASLPTYWIVNLIDRHIEVYSQPITSESVPRYGNRRDYVVGERVPVAIDGLEIGAIAVCDCLP